ncbi:MAG: M15 family metallopeptidase [Eubacteriales bacterium]
MKVKEFLIKKLLPNGITLRRLIFSIIILTIITVPILTRIYFVTSHSNKAVFSDDPIYEYVMKRDILCLMMAYPEYLTGLEKDNDENVYLIMKSGKKILYDDKKDKNSWQKSDNPDLQDMMEEIYPLSDITELLPNKCNPGCLRVYPLFKEVYGQNKKGILDNLVKVSIGYKFVEFNKCNNASKALKSVMTELLPLSRQSNKIYSTCFPSNGAYYYRLIAGTNRLSSHAYGIAIDLNSKKHDYWVWTSREEGQKRLESYPKEIVHIFEKNGFVWGGKWGNFDIMHYEYRPEIILKARYFSEEPIPGIPWYLGLQK